MKLTIGFIVVCAALHAGATNKCPEITDPIVETPPGDGILGQVLELLLGKLNNIERVVLELQFGQHELQEQMVSNKASQTKTFADVLWAINRVDDRLAKDVGRNLTVLQDQSMLILEQQTACSSHDQLRHKMFNLTLKNNQDLIKSMEWIRSLYKSGMVNCVSLVTSRTLQKATTATQKPKQPASCQEVASNVSGVYLIHVDNNDATFQVYCEMEKHGGGWLVVQHRFNGSVDFDRTWDEYREGFGDLNGEFWLGLEKMHQITASRNHELMVEIRDFSGDYGYARYNGFQIGSESEGYKLKTLGDYSGTAGDPMTETNKGREFSTKDRDNDEYSGGSCALERQGAWWYGSCSNANLNGPYKDAVDLQSMYWYYFKNNYQGLSFARIMIREL
ncbi:fibrinogen-like protein A [Anopheles aquasalis]|uniref:fibrinogen-like protein A n=1 Tax=Anopheles aquasalis TaxID=42839 RepID=UPI00215B193F|nr:fibrinogen-like protein A [Anopheles aquasalis]